MSASLPNGAEQPAPPLPPAAPQAPEAPVLAGAPAMVGQTPGPPRVIEVPDGRGGTTRIVIGEDGSVLVGTPGEASAGRRSGDMPSGVIRIVEMSTIAAVAIVLGTSILRLVGRWMERRAAPPTPDVARRLQAIEEAVDSIAIEVERISEGQRFTSRLLAERVHVPAADFVAPAVRDPVERVPR